jgi:outer membrane protein TolC
MPRLTHASRIFLAAMATIVLAMVGCMHNRSNTTQSQEAGAATVPAAIPLATSAYRTTPDVVRLPPVHPLPRLASPSGIQLVSLQSEEEQPRALLAPQNALPATSGGQTQRTVEVIPSENNYPIDLANALALGGASNLQIQLARERVLEAEGRYLRARALWLPSLRFGIGYNKHDGRIQATEGDVVEAGRNSLFVGGGAGLGGDWLTGGSGGPSRLSVNLSLADAAFEPLSAGQELNAKDAAEQAALNDTLRDIAVAYFQLVEAHGRRANADQALKAARAMVDHVTQFEREGFGSKTEVSRAAAEKASWQQIVEDARRESTTKGAELARLLRLDPTIELVPAEDKVLPIELVEKHAEVHDLIGQAMAMHPEITEREALLQAACHRVNQEHWRPWLPNVQVGASGGSFGGGPSSNYENPGGRSDFDALAVWELKNLGYGTAAARRERNSQFAQADLELEKMRDRVKSDVVSALADVTSYRRQISFAQEGIQAATSSLKLNADRIREGEGLPIEVIQSIRALARARDDYTKAVSMYNASQYRLLSAIGQVPAQP